MRQQRRSKTPSTRAHPSAATDGRGQTGTTLYQPKNTQKRVRQTDSTGYRQENKVKGNQKSQTLQSMYKLSGDPDQIEMLAFSSEFCKTPDKLYEQLLTYDIIKEYSEECRFDPSILVKDLSLSVKGP